MHRSSAREKRKMMGEQNRGGASVPFRGASQKDALGIRVRGSSS